MLTPFKLKLASKNSFKAKNKENFLVNNHLEIEEFVSFFSFFIKSQISLISYIVLFLNISEEFNYESICSQNTLSFIVNFFKKIKFEKIFY